jgi:hypothetical protein
MNYTPKPDIDPKIRAAASIMGKRALGVKKTISDTERYRRAMWAGSLATRRKPRGRHKDADV